MHTCFNASKASMAFSVSDTHSDFLLTPSPVRYSLRGCAMCANPLMNLLQWPTRTRKVHTWVCDHGGADSPITSRFELQGWPFSLLKKLHLDGFNFSLCSLNQSKMMCKQWRCSSAVYKKTIISSS